MELTFFQKAKKTKKKKEIEGDSSDATKFLHT